MCDEDRPADPTRSRRALAEAEQALCGRRPTPAFSPWTGPYSVWGVGSRASPLAAVDNHSRLASAELLGSDDGAGEERSSSRSDAARRSLNPVGNLECSNTTEQTCPPQSSIGWRASFGA